MGTGTTGIAALNLKRQFIGIEILKEEYDTAEGNMKARTKQNVDL
jgi:DNA modification methylase